MSDINANIVVTQNEITITATNDEIVITPNPLNMNIFTNDSAPGGFPGDLQYNANGVLGGIPTANYISGNLSLGNSDNLKIAGGSNAYFLQTDGTGNLTWAPGTANVSGNGTSAGANNQIQISDGSGNFKSAPGFTLDTASNLFSAPGNIFANGNANITNNVVIGDNANITGNVSANYYFGNGSFLTGFNSDIISNGNSNVRVLLNGPILISSNGNSNTMSITDSVINIEPEVVINQALTLKKDNVGSDLLFLESYNNSNVQVNGIETRRYRGNTGNPLTVQNGDEIYSIDHRAQYTNGSFNQSTLAGSNTVVTAVNANGNMSVNTTMYASYTNSNLILDYSNIVTNGNMTANLYTGNANGLSNIPGANVTGQVANALIAGTVYTNAQPNITSVGNLSSLVVTGNADTGNLNTTQITASANVTSPQFISNVSTGTSPLTVQSTTKVANLNVDLLDGFNTDSANTANTIPVRDSNGNISANYFIGNGSQLTGIDTSLISNGTANVRTFLNGNVTISAAGTGNVLVVTSTGASIAGTVNATSNITGGNLLGPHANGNSNVNMPAANGNINMSVAGNANILVVTGTGANIAGTLNATGNANVGNLGTVRVLASANVTAPQLVSNIATGTAPLVVTSTTRVANLDVAKSGVANTVNDAAQPNITSVGTLTSLAVTGNITASLLTGTLTTAAQPNITSVGTLTGLTVTGNTNLGNINAGNLLTANFVTGTLTTAAQPNVTSLGNLNSINVGNINANTTPANLILNASSTNIMMRPGDITISVSGTNNVAFVSNAGFFANNSQFNTLKLNSNRVNLGANAGVGAVGSGVSTGVAIGQRAKFQTGSLGDSIAIGADSQQDLGAIIGDGSIAIGIRAAQNSVQRNDSIAIGTESARAGLGTSSIAIGANAAWGANATANNAIVINATGANLEGTTANSLTIKPIRNARNDQTLVYDTTTGEISYTNYVKTISTTVGALVAANTVGAGTRAFVTDANTTTFLATVGGGGANNVPVVSDGTNWLVG